MEVRRGTSSREARHGAGRREPTFDARVGWTIRVKDTFSLNDPIFFNIFKIVDVVVFDIFVHGSFACF